MSLYWNYTAKNNVRSELYAPISSLATIVQLVSWQGERRGNNFPMLATLENLDSDGKVLKREIVKITEREGDTLTIERKAFPCLPSDDANTQGSVSFSFDIWDTISNYIAKEYIDVINNAINDIYDNGDERIKAIPTGWLWIEITDWNVRVGSEEFYFEGGTATLNDNTTNYVMLNGAGTIVIDTEGRNQNYVKVATIITGNGAITSIKQRKMDAVGWMLWGGGGFKIISNCKYNSEWLLKYFLADWEEFYLYYRNRKLVRITSWEKTYTITYNNGRLDFTQEN